MFSSKITKSPIVGVQVDFASIERFIHSPLPGPMAAQDKFCMTCVLKAFAIKVAGSKNSYLPPTEIFANLRRSYINL